MANNAITGFRLSVQQERAFAQAAGGRLPFRSCGVIAVEGPLDSRRLEDGLRRAVERHEILRTVFLRQSGVKLPFQVIRESSELTY